VYSLYLLLFPYFISLSNKYFSHICRRLADIKSRALDHLGRAFALRESYAEAAEIWETRMSLAKTPLERTYLFHEIGRCYLEMNKLDIAKYYGNQSLEEASKINDNIWAMNARIFLGQVESKYFFYFEL
jgi:hypothetical protein